MGKPKPNKDKPDKKVSVRHFPPRSPKKTQEAKDAERVIDEALGRGPKGDE